MTKEERKIAKKAIRPVKDWAKVFYYPHYKTAVLAEKPFAESKGHYHLIITRVNYLTACLWLEYRNQRVNNTKGFVSLPSHKPNWLVMIRIFRRTQDRKMKIIEYLKERKKRTADYYTKKDK